MSYCERISKTVAVLTKPLDADERRSQFNIYLYFTHQVIEYTKALFQIWKSLQSKSFSV